MSWDKLLLACGYQVSGLGLPSAQSLCRTKLRSYRYTDIVPCQGRRPSSSFQAICCLISVPSTWLLGHCFERHGSPSKLTIAQGWTQT